MWSRTKKTQKQSSRTVTRPSADFQTRFFRRFKRLRKILRRVAQLSRDSGWRSRNCRPTVKQRFFDVSSNSVKFWKKSLNDHATVVGGHATIGWPSNSVFLTFQAIRKKFEKSRWTVTRQWSEVTRPSADCQTTFFWRFKLYEKFWKKLVNGHASVVEGHATIVRLSNNVFSTFQAIRKNFEKKSLIGHATVVGGHATVVGGHATVGRLSSNVFSTFQTIQKNFEKSRWTVTRQWSEVTRQLADCHALCVVVSWLGWIPHQFACKSVHNLLNITLALLCIQTYV